MRRKQGRGRAAVRAGSPPRRTSAARVAGNSLPEPRGVRVVDHQRGKDYRARADHKDARKPDQKARQPRAVHEGHDGVALAVHEALEKQRHIALFDAQKQKAPGKEDRANLPPGAQLCIDLFDGIGPHNEEGVKRQRRRGRAWLRTDRESRNAHANTNAGACGGARRPRAPAAASRASGRAAGPASVPGWYAAGVRAGLGADLECESPFFFLRIVTFPTTP